MSDVVDPFTLQVMGNHLRAAAETMAYTLYRTAFSTFVKETEDFTTQITDAAGVTVAVPMDLGATWFPGITYGGVMLLNVRKPDQNAGDLRAFIGALNTGERKLLEMAAKFGAAPVQAGMARLLDYAEHQAREVLASIPDGEYFFADYADEDFVGGNLCRVALTLRITGDAAELDFTGSDPRLTSALNVPTGGDPRHTLLLVGVYYVLCTLSPGITLNAGLTRPFTCIVPEGTVLNPHPPAAVGMRSLTCARLRSLIIGAFGLAVPQRMPAAPAGSSSIVNVMTTDNRTHRTVLAAVNPVVGGAGGMPHRDGTNGSGADAAYLKNTPIEVTEAEVPIQFLRYGLRRDSGGAGYVSTAAAFPITAWF